ncbi:MAG TPA: class I SAM-dependent methyltransferase [Gammaproteobacteria bacterium]|nr:class I SAM-dependent methyltransferase [Gammaproteobacteria bacterium]
MASHRAFTDHFGGRGMAYARHRPTYPPALYRRVLAACRGRDLAWDCGTGSGQAARVLAAHFRAVVATDASPGQIAAAPPTEGVAFLQAPAERAPLRDASVDLITVAQALHWFDRDAFFAEVHRVLRPQGVLAVWTYDRPRLPGRLDAPLRRLHDDLLAPFWPPQRRLVSERYAGIELPFEALPVAHLEMERRWTPAELFAYLATWSAIPAAQAAGIDPWHELRVMLADCGERLRVRWPLTLRLSRRPEVSR